MSSEKRDNGREEEEEELSFDEEEEEDDDEEEEEERRAETARRPSSAKKKKRLKKQKRSKPRSGFIDDVAEEDDDEDEDDDERSRRQKRSRFIDDIAEVDDDEEDDELEEEGLDDLIDDAGEPAENAADLVAMRRQMREAEAQAAKDSEMNPDELQAYLKSRYGGQSYLGGGAGVAEDLGAVAQQALLPKPSDPKLWVVRCAEGAEREIVICLLQKCYDLAQRGQPLLIKSAACQDHLKGYLYVEAHKEAHVTEALRGLRAVFMSKKPTMVPLGEMTAAVAVQARAARSIEPDSWVRIKAGVYKGDLAQVVDLDAGGARATIRIVPRLDLAALANRKPGDARANFGRQPRVRPAQRPFNVDEARQYKALDVLTQRDRSTGGLVHVLNGSQRFADGYLIKSVAVKGLVLEEGVPALDDLQQFQAAGQGAGGGDGNGGGAGSSGLSATEDLASLVQALNTGTGGAGGAAGGSTAGSTGANTETRFGKGDEVIVTSGDLAGIRGVVEGAGEDGQVMVRPVDAKLPGFAELVGFAPRELEKHFDPGSHVRVVAGTHLGETGMLVGSSGPVATVFTDVTRREIRVLVRDLAKAAGVAAVADTLGGYELHDLVVLDATTVGVIVGIDRDAVRVLTNQGRPDKPDVRVAHLPDLKRKLLNRRAAVQDGARNEVTAGDIVEIADGPLRGASGTVRGVVRGFLFVQGRGFIDHGGFVCVQARHCRVRGGRRPAPLADPMATPAARFGQQAAPQGVLASPARQGPGGGWGGAAAGGGSAGGYGAGRVSTSADRLLEGRVITIRQGPHRGMRGRVVSCTPTHLRLELEAQMKTVTVSRSHVAMEDGGMRGAAGAGGGGGFFPGATPAHPGITATPAHWSSTGATPAREALTRTPAYDPAWAATPAHPGFGSGTASDYGSALPASPRRGGTGASRYHMDTPGGYGAPTPGTSAGYAGMPSAAPSPYSPLPAMTPGLAATPGLSYEPSAAAAEASGAASGPAPAAASAAAAHWVGIEVLLGTDGGRGAVVSVDSAGAQATVRVGRQTGHGSWEFPEDGETLLIPVTDLQSATPERSDMVKLLQGDLAGKVGELVGTDGGDGIVKLGPEIKIWELAHVGRMAKLS